MDFIVPVPNNGSVTRSNNVVYNGEPDTKEARGFQCYVGNPGIDTFDFIVLTLRNDPNQPISEYLMPIPTGYALWSAVNQVANVSIVTNRLGEQKFNKNLDLYGRTPMGHRRDMLICNSKTVR